MSSSIVQKLEEDGNSRDSGICSSRQSPEPNELNTQTLTVMRDDNNKDEWDPEFLYGDLLFTEKDKCVVDPLQKAIIRRIPLLDRTNTSNSSQGSIKSNPRSNKQRVVDSVDGLSCVPARRLLSSSMFPDSEDDESILSMVLPPSSIMDDTFDSVSMMSSSSNRALFPNASQPPLLRRTLSDFIERPSRKRSSDSFSDRERKRSKAVVIPLDEDVDLDDSVFTAAEMEDCSPDVSVYSMTSQPSRSVTRATSCGVLEMGEHHAPSPSLPKMLEVHYSLPFEQYPQKDSQAFRSISAGTLAAELRRLGDDQFRERYTLVDCRYPYEYEGGHVKTAINVHDQRELEQMFFTDDLDAPIRSRIPIFYCEFSQKRGPGMAHHLRSLDRQRNELNYPEVDYKEIYLLDYGYQRFWKEGLHTDLCEPESYVPMLEKQHQKTLSTYKWHKSRSAYNLDKDRAAAGADRPLARRCRGVLFTRHQSLMQVDSSADQNDLSRRTPSSSRTRSMMSLDDGQTTGGSMISLRTKLSFDSPDKNASLE